MDVVNLPLMRLCANWAAGVDKQFRDLGMGSPFVSSGIGALDSLGFMSRSAKRRVGRSGKISMCHPGLPLQRGQSSARITIGLAGLVICDLSPTMSCQWASAKAPGFGAVQTWFPYFAH